MSRLSTSLLPTCLLLAVATPALAEVPAGEPIENALYVDVTDEGFAAISESLPSFVPADLDIPDINQRGSAGFDWEASATGLDLDVDVQKLSLVPQEGYLLVDGTIGAQLNSSSDPANIKFVYKTPRWLGGPWTLANCGFWMRPITIDIQTRVYLDVVVNEDGERELDATISTIDWDWTLTGTDLQVDDCWLGAINDILEYVDFSLFDLVLGPIEGLIDDQIQGLVADLEPTLEDAFNTFSLDESFDLNGTPLRVVVEPHDVRITPDGMRLQTSGLAEAEEAACVAGSGITGSRETPNAAPDIGVGPLGAHDVGILGSDDFVNQVLFAAYRGGALCVDLSGDQGDLPLNTGVLGLLAPGAYDELFPEPKPIAIEIRPTSPPVAVPKGAYDVTLVAEDMALDIYGELDGRQALLVGIDLDIEAGANLEFDGETGALAVDVDLGSDNLTAEVRTNELAPEANEQIPERVGELFDTLAAPLLGDALSGLSFNLPSFAGFGLQSLEAAPAGAQEDWFGFYAGAGDVPYGGGGCGDGGGCADSGGDCGGCSSSASGRGITLVFLPLLVAFMRRRRQR